MANILVVDDEIGIRELLSEILSDEGHAVELAENAAQARDFRREQAPDMVLLDIWMPDTDGVTLLKEWASNGLLTMPVVMMSGHGTIDTAVEATRIGAIDFLEKPIALQKLLNAVKRGLERRPPGFRAPLGGRSVSKVSSATRDHDFYEPEPRRDDEADLDADSGESAEIPPGVSSILDIQLDLPLREARDAFERSYFEHHLAQEHGSMTRVAAKTGLERTHLYRKLKQLGIELNRPPKK